MTRIHTQRRSTPPRPAPAQRRQMTVLFCDLAGFTGLSEQLDPESLHRVVSRYHGLCARVVARHGGQVRQYLGDGVLAYFGHEQTSPNQAAAACRAVAAGLAIAKAIGGLERRFAPLEVSLTVRVGIHSGAVALGSTGGGDHREVLAVGQVPNMAARLQALAGDNQVVVSQTVRELTGEHFDGQALGARRLKGFSSPVQVHRLQRRPRPSRPDPAPTPDPALPPTPPQRQGTGIGAAVAVAVHRERWLRLPATVGPPVPTPNPAGQVVIPPYAIRASYAVAGR